MLKAVIFDLGGTLMRFGDPEIDFRELEQIGIQGMHGYLAGLGQNGLPEKDAFCSLVDERLEGAWQRSLSTLQSACMDEILAELLAEWRMPADDDVVRALLDAFHRPMQPYIRLYDDTQATLETFKSAGLRIGLVSNTIFTPAMHDSDLARLGIRECFDHLVYSSAFPHTKPHPAIFQHSLGALGVSADQAIFCGDRIVDDIGGAQGAGMRAVLKAPPDRDESHESIIPDARIHTLRELWDMVLGA